MAWNTGIEEQTPAYRFASDPSRIIRVVAGPGTGKSYGLQRRVARLLEEGQNPNRVLAVTFTRTAAQDLRNEISSVNVIGSDKVVAKTLHSLCFGLLNKHDIIIRTGRYPRPMLDFEQKPMLYDLDCSFGNLRDKQNRLQAFEASWARLQSETPGFPSDEIDRRFEREIKKWLKIHRSMLFGEMIIETFHYLRNNPQCTELGLFDHILVDEYQDLNRAEQAVIDLLATNSNLVIIGDDDQSIYSFKHAHPEGIREFPRTHPDCDAIDFAECRRCPKQVVAMASRLISNNNNRTLGNLKPFESNQNGNVIIVQWKTLEDEIRGISNNIYREIALGAIQPEDVLILAPVRKIGYRVRDTLVKLGISAKSYFRETALSTDELRYSFTLLNLLAKPDDMVAWRYILGYGSSNYRTKSYSRIVEYATKFDLSVYDTLEQLAIDRIKIPYSTTLADIFTKTKAKLTEIKSVVNGNSEALLDILAEENEDNTDFRNILSEAFFEVGIEQKEGLDEWFKDIYSFVVERVSFPENTSLRDHVRIMSLHASKGLSAKYVVVMSAIEELIPRLNKSSDISIEKQLEEQRRLFYVAITRCKSSKNDYPGTLIISSFINLPGNEALNMNIPASPYNWRSVSASQFIREFEDTAPVTIKP
jgi:DNA helicase II / ATP-dependent DNA helicase PcrA